MQTTKKKPGRPANQCGKPVTQNEKLAAKIRKLRAGRSVEDLAAAAGCSAGYWYKLERAAVVNPGMATVSQIMDVLRE